MVDDAADPGDAGVRRPGLHPEGTSDPPDGEAGGPTATIR